MSNFIAIIPARYASTRFPGKPLVDIAGKTMIQRVYERAASAICDVVVATDDERILKAVIQFGGNAVMTSGQHRSGTDRCTEALDLFSKISGKKYDVVVNIQGDEPFIRSEQIEQLKMCFSDELTQIATLIKPIIDNEIIFDPNRPKVIIDAAGFALYFSRSAIPFIRDKENSVWVNSFTFFQHIGLYAYRSDVLHQLTKLLPGKLEKAESLEQLRWLENGYKIKTSVTNLESFGIDTPADLEKILHLLSEGEI